MAETAEEIREHSKVYIKILMALFALTLLTVGVSYYDFGGSAFMSIFVGLLIATIKGSLVACYFMHLIDEKKIIYWVLSLTVFFFAVLMVVPFLTDSNSVFNN
jgi:cytochrome c oxidase subunit 4